MVVDPLTLYVNCMVEGNQLPWLGLPETFLTNYSDHHLDFGNFLIGYHLGWHQ